MESTELLEIKELQKQELRRILQECHGPKDLILDPDIIPILDRIAGMEFLRENGVQRVHKINPKELEIKSEIGKHLYLMRGTLRNVKTVCDQISHDIRIRQDQKNYPRKRHLVFIPRRTPIIEFTLEQYGIMGHVEVQSLDIDLVMLDHDILSLEMPELLRSVFLDRDYTGLHSVARSIEKIISQYGHPTNIYGQGAAAKMVDNLVQKMTANRKPPKTKPLIGNLILIDRNVDYITPLCTQQTYTGILDDWFNTECGKVTFPGAVGIQEDVTKSFKYILNSDDKMFKFIRDEHIQVCVQKLRTKLSEINTTNDTQFENLSAKEMKNFVKTIPQHKQDQRNLKIHWMACEYIFKELESESATHFPDVVGGDPALNKKLEVEEILLDGSDVNAAIEFIKECICRRYSPLTSLRLLCLLSSTYSGIPTARYKELKRLYAHTYGYDHLLTWFNLAKAGLLVEDTAGHGSGVIASGALAFINKRDMFKQLRKRLHLIPNDREDVRFPKTMGYVFGGVYIPLSCKLVELALTKGDLGSEDLQKHISGEYFARVMGGSVKMSSARKTGPDDRTTSPEQVALVYFIGGITYSEIAALRFWAQKNRFKLIFAATAIINGDRMMNSFLSNSN